MKIAAYILLSLMATAMPVAAQDITTEVVVERSVQPVERAATRPSSLVPSLQLPTVQPVQLSTARYLTLSPVERSFARLQPARGITAPPLSDYRGYVSVGYFPVYNLGVAAGYRAIDNGRSQLDLHLNFNGLSYNDIKEAPRRNAYNGGTLGADYTLQVNDRSRLSASIDYTYASAASMWSDQQSRNAGRLAASWQSGVQGLDYQVYLDASVDAFSKATLEIDTYDGIKEQQVSVGGNATLPFGKDYGVGLAIDASFLHDALDSRLASYAEASTIGIIGLRPFVHVNNEQITASAGLNLDFFTGGDAKMYLSPRVEVAWSPMAALTVMAAATGGTGFNSVQSALDICPFIPGAMPSSRYRIPLDVSGKIVAGPFAGFTAALTGGYAKADNWLAPGHATPLFPLSTREIKGWHAGIKLDYTHRIFGIYAAADIASSDHSASKGYYLWADGARTVITAGAHVKPLKGLTIGLDYELRTRRHTPDVDLGCASELNARATYAITPAIDVFANVENILGRRYLIVPGIRNQPIHGLVGITLKF